MYVSSQLHFGDDDLVPSRKARQAANPPQRFGVTRVTFAAVDQDRANPVQLTVLREQALPVQISGRDIPDSHAVLPASLSTVVRGKYSLTPMATTVRWALLAASFVVGAAALLRMASPAASVEDGVAGAIRLPVLVTATILSLFAIAGLVFLLGVARRMRRRRARRDAELFGAAQEPPPPWMRTVTQFLSLLNVLLLAYLVWRGVIPLADLVALGQGAMGLSASLPQAPGIDAPFLVRWTFGALAVAAGVAALALAVWLALGDRLAEWWERRARRAQLQTDGSGAPGEALDGLGDGTDPRSVIIRCYRTFARVAAGSGVERQPWHTPAEFMREVLGRLSVPHGAVPTLTRLFELARFSRRELGAEDRERAVGALHAITTTVGKRGADVVG